MVILTVSNDYGSSYETKNNFITIIGPLTAKFNADPGSGRAPLLVEFTDRSIGGPTSWKWDFGDGTSSAEQNPTHTFTTGGDSWVKIEITRGGGTPPLQSIVNVGGVPVQSISYDLPLR